MKRAGKPRRGRSTTSTNVKGTTVNTVRDVEYFQFGTQVYSVPAGKPQPADGVFVELTTYMQPVPKVTIQGLGFHPEWIV